MKEANDNMDFIIYITLPKFFQLLKVSDDQISSFIHSKMMDDIFFSPSFQFAVNSL